MIKFEKKKRFPNIKIFTRTTIEFTVFLSLFLLFGQTIYSQQNKCIEADYWVYDDVMDKFGKYRSGLSSEQINANLIPEIRKNKAGFDLTSEREKELRLAGANDLLINTIRENQLPADAIEAIKLYRIYEYHYQFTDDKRVKIALDAANNFIAKFGNNDCYKEQTEYFRNIIPLAEKILNKENISVPVDPTTKHKYELLGQVEKAYRLKNWDEVFIIGERVLDIDPEYIDLILVLASVSYEQTQTEAYKGKFDKEAIRYAELALKLMESGKYLKTQNYGALHFRYRTKAVALSKMKQILESLK